MRRTLVLSLTAAALFLAGCVTTTTSPEPQSAPQQSTVAQLSVSQANARLAPIKARMEPVAERECRARTTGMNCDFLIRVHPDAGMPANAYQSLGKSGRPVITFTSALVSDIRNDDELAFVMGHEAAHHIGGDYYDFMRLDDHRVAFCVGITKVSQTKRIRNFFDCRDRTIGCDRGVLNRRNHKID